jgi:hypothetical protein
LFSLSVFVYTADMYGLGGGGSRLQPVTIKAPALHSVTKSTYNHTALRCHLCHIADMYGLGGGGSRLQPVTIKAPALRFMQQLDVLLQKILPKICDRVKRRIMPMLVSGLLALDVVLFSVAVCTYNMHMNS